MISAENFPIFALNLECGCTHRGGFNEYPVFVSAKNKQSNVYPAKPLFHYIKRDFHGLVNVTMWFLTEEWSSFEDV